MAEIKQHADGSASWFTTTDARHSGRHGGPSTGSNTAPKYRVPQTAIFSITGTTSTSAGGVFTWRPDDQGAAHYVQHVGLDITTKSTGAASLDVGVGATATTTSDTLLDGVDVATAAGAFDNFENAGTNGGSFRKLAAGEYVTATGSASTAGLVGTVHVTYWPA